jgi:hypothetical protein
MLIDLHARTRATVPGGHEARKIISAARRAGLDGVAFVDRLHSSHARELTAVGEEENFPVFIGVEIPALTGRFLCFGPEVDPFFQREEWRQLMAISVNPTVKRVIDLFENIGGAVVAAQPYAREDGTRLGDKLVLYDRLSGVEVFSPQCRHIERVLAMEAGVKMGLPLAAGSETGRSLGDVGQAATLFSSRIQTQREFVEALRSGEFWAVDLTDQSPRSRRGGGKRSGGRGKSRPTSGRRRRRRSRGRSSGGK